MKTRFNSYDIVCNVAELQKLVGLRVNRIYDIDNRTYLIRFQATEEKCVLLLESGQRFHTTAFEWPKSMAPNGFTSKLRKHLNNKRLEKFTQLGVDRIIDLEFGSGVACYHVIVELYDRGNIILTDYEMTILNILRPHTEGEQVRFAVRERYPESRMKLNKGPPESNVIREALQNAKPGDNLRKSLNTNLEYGSALIDHVLTKYNLQDCKLLGKEEIVIKVEEEENVETEINATENELNDNKKGNKKGGGNTKKGKKPNKVVPKKIDNTQRIFNFETDFNDLMKALHEADDIIEAAKLKPSKGYLIIKRELKPQTIKQSNTDETPEHFDHYIEFHPFLFQQYQNQPYRELSSFDAAVDEFYSKQEGQKLDMKSFQQEREALKKLSNVKLDHEKRLQHLNKYQVVDRQRAELITRNQELVDQAILAIRSALAKQMAWPEIQELVNTAQSLKDPIASHIKQLKLEMNHITLYLMDPYANDDDDDEDEDEEEKNKDEVKLEPMLIDIDLDLSAFANATRYYDQKRSAANKVQRTIESSAKALKSAERLTQQALKEMKTISTITKARKIYWFEKFYWFISSENYLVIGGRDAQQNELIVKRYMRTNDIYVHADIQGATSVVIRNVNADADIPPKTLLEAGAMAISYSVAWDAKVVTSAYWVKSDQVSKTAPTGEYLSTGSFMIRGKKNFLPPCHLILGMSILFKLEDGSVERHAGERQQRNFDDNDSLSRTTSILTVEHEQLETVNEEDDKEIEINDDSDSDNSDSIGDDDNIEKTESNERKDSVEFPDTQVHIEHNTGKVTLHKDPTIERMQSVNEDQDYIVFLGDDKPVIVKDKGIGGLLDPNSKMGRGGSTISIHAKTSTDGRTQHIKNQQIKIDEQNATVKQSQPPQLKRGQKSKLKKIKEKYKDQDEEEKEIRMAILKSAGTAKINEKTKNKKTPMVDSNTKKKLAKNAHQQLQQKLALINLQSTIDDEQIIRTETKALTNQMVGKNITNNNNNDDNDGDDAEDNDETPINVDLDILITLTGCPIDEDELLFAIPIIAPYQALQNYKYKVKLTPGTTRRGKLAKAAMLMFTKDKSCTNREKDLLKGVKDEVVARNIPGKCKLSAPQALRSKK